MLTTYFPFDSWQSFSLTNQYIEVQQDHEMKETASRHVKCIKGPTMSEEESSFENASYAARLKLVSPGILQFCNSHLTQSWIFTPIFVFALQRITSGEDADHDQYFLECFLTPLAVISCRMKLLVEDNCSYSASSYSPSGWNNSWEANPNCAFISWKMTLTDASVISMLRRSLSHVCHPLYEFCSLSLCIGATSLLDIRELVGDARCSGQKWEALSIPSVPAFWVQQDHQSLQLRKLQHCTL